MTTRGLPCARTMRRLGLASQVPVPQGSGNSVGEIQTARRQLGELWVELPLA
jgi:hypothetical protein